MKVFRWLVIIPVGFWACKFIVIGIMLGLVGIRSMARRVKPHLQRRVTVECDALLRDVVRLTHDVRFAAGRMYSGSVRTELKWLLGQLRL
jgi:hypothetical protein